MHAVLTPFIACLRGLVAAGILLRDGVAWVGAPLWRWFARWRWLQRFSLWVATLRPWQVLALLAVPLAVAEPLKIAGLYALATGQLALGLVLQGLGHAVSLILAERILHAGHDQLMRYRWFAALHRWYGQVRAGVARWLVRSGIRAWIARLASVARRFAIRVKVTIAKGLRSQPRG